jgi:hypothetical protein
MVCKGICESHKAIEPMSANRYSNGLKRCKKCDVYLKWDKILCPCCHGMLRGKPRNAKDKKRFLELLVS